MENVTNIVWKQKLGEILTKHDYVSSPRGMEIHEQIGGMYSVPMPAFIDLVDRKVNVKFMFAEAAWIISGSNRLSGISPAMKGYARFSDDGVFLRGAYGPKVVDQLGYVVDTLVEDNDSRQAVINIWRERPGKSKDIPCTLSMQFILREGNLHMVTTMRSNDIVLGFTYDVFTFSMVAFAVVMLLKERGIEAKLGQLVLTAGSMHLYSDYYDKALDWTKSVERDLSISAKVNGIVRNAKSYEDLVARLKRASK